MKEEILKKYIDLADQYLDGTISSEGLRELKSGMKQEPFLNKVVEQHLQIRANIRVQGEQQLRASLMSRFDQSANETSKSKTWLKVLGGLLLAGIIALAFWWMQSGGLEKNDNQNENEKVEQVQFVAEIEKPSFDIMRADNQIVHEKQWSQAVQYFQNDQYEKCLEEIEKIENEEFFQKSIGKISILKSYAQIQSNRREEAFNTLNQISVDNPYYDQRQWYQAVNAFQLKDDNLCRKYLNEILSVPDHYKLDEARSMLEEIKD